MLNHLTNHFNETTTTNGAFAYKSTKSSVLDLFSQGGAMRTNNDSDIIQLFSKAFAEDATLALKTLFYLRDVKQGQGERKFFRLAIKHLALNNKASLAKNLHLVPEFGRWDDLWVLLDTDLKANVVSLVTTQLKADKKAENPSLLAKWMPSENTSSEQTKAYAKTLRESFGTTPKKYRKLLSALRAKINLVETKLTNKEYDTIDYSKLPSKAGMQYRTAFFRNDEERYKSFLDSLEKGEVKVNAGTLYPNDIVGKIIDAGGYNVYGDRHRLTKQDVQLFDGQWKNLTDYIGENKEDSIVMADVSASMRGIPLSVSMALAVYIAERNEGAYKDHFISFSGRPQLIKLQGTNIVEKISNMPVIHEQNTNIELALKTLLNVAVKNNVPKDEMVKKIYIISDMQFDSATSRSNNIFGNMEKEFNENGYDVPNIVFWNVNASGNTPMTMNSQGVQLVSGFSPSILTQLLNADGKTPYEFMLDVVESDRYKEITA